MNWNQRKLSWTGRKFKKNGSIDSHKHVYIIEKKNLRSISRRGSTILALNQELTATVEIGICCCSKIQFGEMGKSFYRVTELLQELSTDSSKTNWREMITFLSILLLLLLFLKEKSSMTPNIFMTSVLIIRLRRY